MNFTNTTNIPIEDSVPTYLGYIAIIITVVFWGSFFLPVKRFDTGDGVFFQVFVCLGIWTVSYVVNWIRNFPKFYALPMICGLTFLSLTDFFF